MNDTTSRRVLEMLALAEAEFAMGLGRLQLVLEGDPSRPTNMELRRQYERYVPSYEVTTLARFFYMLGEYGVTTASSFRALLTDHNARIDSLAANPTYLAKYRLRADRLNEGRFPPGAINNAVANLTRYSRTALDGSTIARLNVEFVNKTQVFEALEVLTRLRPDGGAEPLLVRHTDGHFYGSRVYESTGQLEAIYRDYLRRIARLDDAAPTS